MPQGPIINVESQAYLGKRREFDAHIDKEFQEIKPLERITNVGHVALHI